MKRSSSMKLKSHRPIRALALPRSAIGENRTTKITQPSYSLGGNLNGVLEFNYASAPCWKNSARGKSFNLIPYYRGIFFAKSDRLAARIALSSAYRPPVGSTGSRVSLMQN
jgi:hypothetical protein